MLFISFHFQFKFFLVINIFKLLKVLAMQINGLDLLEIYYVTTYLKINCKTYITHYLIK